MPNKPTTLRESLDEIFEDMNSYTGPKLHEDELFDRVLDFITSHNTELLQKIEGLRLEIDPLSVNKRGHHTNGAHRKIRYNRALDDIIKIINQEK